MEDLRNKLSVRVRRRTQSNQDNMGPQEWILKNWLKQKSSNKDEAIIGTYFRWRLSTPKPSSLDWVWPWTFKYCCKATNKSYISHFFSFVKRHVLSLVFRPFFYNKTRPGIFFEREKALLFTERDKNGSIVPMATKKRWCAKNLWDIFASLLQLQKARYSIF